LDLSREIFLGRRDEDDIKSKKKSEEFKQFCLQQEDYETRGKKKRKLNPGATTTKKEKAKVASSTVTKPRGSPSAKSNPPKLTNKSAPKLAKSTSVFAYHCFYFVFLIL
jgi:hypothetical protein